MPMHPQLLCLQRCLLYEKRCGSPLGCFWNEAWVGPFRCAWIWNCCLSCVRWRNNTKYFFKFDLVSWAINFYVSAVPRSFRTWTVPLKLRAIKIGGSLTAKCHQWLHRLYALICGRGPTERRWTYRWRQFCNSNCNNEMLMGQYRVSGKLAYFVKFLKCAGKRHGIERLE